MKRLSQQGDDKQRIEREKYHLLLEAEQSIIYYKFAAPSAINCAIFYGISHFISQRQQRAESLPRASWMKHSATRSPSVLDMKSVFPELRAALVTQINGSLVGAITWSSTRNKDKSGKRTINQSQSTSLQADLQPLKAILIAFCLPRHACLHQHYNSMPFDGNHTFCVRKSIKTPTNELIIYQCVASLSDLFS